MTSNSFHNRGEFSGSWDNANANGNHSTMNTNTTMNNTSISEDGEQVFVFFEPSTRPHNIIVVGVLIGFIILLFLILTFVTLPPLYACIRRKIPVSQRRIDRRYATIEGWLISKVSRVDHR
jgi:CBS domain containing-hemolysin-like protein